MVAWRKLNPNYHREWAAKRYTKDAPRYKVYARKGALKAKYGISLEAYEEMLNSQNGVCAICGDPPKKYRLAVDHCHGTGKVRKLLCIGCNAKLAAIEDQEFGQKAEAYLTQFN